MIGGLSANSRLRRFSPEFAAARGFDLPNGSNAPASRWGLKSASLLISCGKVFPLHRRIVRRQSKATGFAGRKPQTDAQMAPNCFQYGKGSKGEI